MIYDPAADTGIDFNVPDVTNLLGWGKTPANLWFETGLESRRSRSPSCRHHQRDSRPRFSIPRQSEFFLTAFRPSN
jgi:hypothetical protein